MSPATFWQSAFAPRVLLLASVFTLLNLGKPITIDDPVYFRLGQQIAQSPLDPYGCTIFWFEEREPANHVLAPAVFPYYLGAVFRILGENLLLVKLALFPWAWLLVAALDQLLVRIAPLHRLPFLIGTVLSPHLVPGFNLMLDVPALALALTAVVLFLSAQDRGCCLRALGAGIVLGLAMQTKYTAFVVPCVILWAACLRGGWIQALLTVGVAGGLFIGWEGYLTWKYGQSHFLLSAAGQGGLLERATGMVPFFLSYTGALGCIILLGGITLLRGPTWLWITGIGVILGIHGMLLVFDARLTNDTRLSPMLFGPSEGLREVIQPAEPAFIVLGCAIVAILVLVLIRLYRQADSATDRWLVFFLAGWLILESGTSLVLSPFPAARRMFGVLTVGILILARLAEGTPTAPGGLVRTIALVGSQVILALIYGVLDFQGAWIHRAGAEQAAQWIQEHDPREKQVWFVGHWGFQHYAEQAGMQPLQSEVSATPDQIAKGDWLVVPDSRLEQQRIHLSEDEVERLHTIRLAGWIPVRTVPCFHGGRIPLEHFEGPILEVHIYRARTTFVARSGKVERYQGGY